MIISKAPFRMSFFGGGTDYPPFFQENGGSVISTTIDKYVYVTVRHLPPFFDYRTQLTYSKIERVRHVEELEHPLVRNAMKFLNMHDLHISYDADLPARSGLGSSSSFAAALLQAFHALKGHYISPENLAKESIHVERVLCNESGGWQDQIAASYGGLNRINFKGNSFEVQPIIISNERKEKLNNNLMLFFTGFTRLSSEIAMEQEKSVQEKHKELLEMLSLVDEAENVLESKHGDLDEFGRLLHHTWLLKRGINSQVSTSELDLIYERARRAGALGGKLLGAGGGGFFVFYVPKEQQPAVRAALHDLLYVPFEFEDGGSRILHYKPEEYTVCDEKKLS
jgi:D-glycero-alpha-D-manno-heptose-7-phosphate kinase